MSIETPRRPSNPQRPQSFAIALNPDRTAPKMARELVARISRGVVLEIVDDLELIVSELVTNSAKYGPGEPIRLRLSVLSPTWVVGEVRDRSSGRIVLSRGSEPREGTPPSERHGQWGLDLVDDLSDEWGLDEAGQAIWFRLARDAQLVA